MTRILVPTDFSEPSLAAVRYGIELATAVGGVVLLLHVVEGASVRCYTRGELPRFLRDMIDPGGDSFRSPSDQKPIRRDFCEEARWKLGALVPPRCRARIHTVVTVGKPVSEIVRVAKEQHADLILLGAGGVRGWRHVFRRRSGHRWAADSGRDVLDGCHDPDPVSVELRFSGHMRGAVHRRAHPPEN
jgi:nucleotide-binding universal stress UspA family protein